MKAVTLYGKNIEHITHFHIHLPHNLKWIPFANTLLRFLTPSSYKEAGKIAPTHWSVIRLRA